MALWESYLEWILNAMVYSFFYNCKPAFLKWAMSKKCHSDRYFRASLPFPQLLSMSLKTASNLSSLPQKLWGLICQGANRKLRQINQLVKPMYSSYEVNQVTPLSPWRSASSYSFSTSCSHLLSVALAGSAQVFKPEHRIHSVSSLKFIWIAWVRKVEKKLIRKHNIIYLNPTHIQTALTKTLRKDLIAEGSYNFTPWQMCNLFLWPSPREFQLNSLPFQHSRLQLTPVSTRKEQNISQNHTTKMFLFVAITAISL